MASLSTQEPASRAHSLAPHWPGRPGRPGFPWTPRHLPARAHACLLYLRLLPLQRARLRLTASARLRPSALFPSYCSTRPGTPCSSGPDLSTLLTLRALGRPTCGPGPDPGFLQTAPATHPPGQAWRSRYPSLPSAGPNRLTRMRIQVPIVIVPAGDLHLKATGRSQVIGVRLQRHLHPAVLQEVQMGSTPTAAARLTSCTWLPGLNPLHSSHWTRKRAQV
jgi:hypothetical protein